MASFTRSYISIIPSLLEWKEEALYLYSDAHKDAYGCRYYPSHLLDAEHSMEEVMDAVRSIYEQADAEAREEREIAEFVYNPTMFTNNIVI